MLALPAAFTVAFIIQLFRAIYDFTQNKTLKGVVNGIVTIACFVAIPISLEMPPVELYPTNGVLQEGKATLKADGGFQVFYALDPDIDPGEKGVLYDGPLEIKESTQLNAKSKFLFKWGPLCTWELQVGPSGEVTSIEGKLTKIVAEYVGDTSKTGEPLTNDSFIVKGTLSNGNEVKEVELNDFCIEEGDSSQLGNHTVNITYGSQETTCEVPVIYLSKIEATYQGDEVKDNDKLTPEMFRVLAIYSDGSSKEIDGFTISPEELSEPSNQKVTVEYKGKQESCVVATPENGGSNAAGGSNKGKDGANGTNGTDTGTTVDPTTKKTDTTPSNGESKISPSPDKTNPYTNTNDTKPSATWVLADACDWLDKMYEPKKRDAKAAEALAEHLDKDARVTDVKQYGTSVLFRAMAEDGNVDSTLHCISLEPAGSGMLGATDDHTFAKDGPSLDAFEALKSKKSIEAGAAITAGDTITSGDVLILEPTPELMENDLLQNIEVAAQTYATALGGESTIKKGDEALRSLLDGELYGYGVVVLRAHGIEVPDSGTMLLQMQAAEKEANASWDDVREGLQKYVDRLAKSSSREGGDIFSGNADDPGAWRCVVTARATEDAAKWDVGLSVAPSIISSHYSQKPLDECILWLSACGGLADESFNEWAAERSHGVRLVLGYEGPVSEEKDAERVSDMLAGLVTELGSSEPWRCKSVDEVLGESSDLLTTQDTETPEMTSPKLFALGTGAISGSVVDKNNEALSGAAVEAWHYFGREFSPVSTGETLRDGSFKLKGLPCGRYVLTVTYGDVRESVTIVLDKESVDGGSIKLDTTKETSGTNGSNTNTSDTYTGSNRSADSTSSSTKGSDSDATQNSKPPTSSTVSLGVANMRVTADDECYYMGINANKKGDASAKSKVVCVRRDNFSKYKTLFSGAQGVSFGTLKRTGDTIVVSTLSQNGDVSLGAQKTSSSEPTTIVDAKMIGKNTSDQLFVCSGGRVYYGAVHGSKWQVRSCGIDGSDDKLLCEGKSSQSSVCVSVLTVADGKVFFGVQGTGTSASTVLYSVEADGSKQTTQTKVLPVESSHCPQVLGSSIYTVEKNEFVSYSLEGKNR